jgi:hypothetical protein
LSRLRETVEELASELWVLSHPDLKGNPRVRAFSDFSAKWLKTRLNTANPPAGGSC